MEAKEPFDEQLGLGVAAGVGYSLGQLQSGLRYIYGLVNLSTEIQYTGPNGEPLPEQPRLFNQVLQASLGYVIFQK